MEDWGWLILLVEAELVEQVPAPDIFQIHHITKDNGDAPLKSMESRIEISSNSDFNCNECK